MHKAVPLRKVGLFSHLPTHILHETLKCQLIILIRASMLCKPTSHIPARLHKNGTAAESSVANLLQVINFSKIKIIEFLELSFALLSSLLLKFSRSRKTLKAVKSSYFNYAYELRSNMALRMAQLSYIHWHITVTFTTLAYGHVVRPQFSSMKTVTHFTSHISSTTTNNVDKG